MSYMICCVPGCSSRAGVIPLHHLPNPENDIKRFRLWVMNIGGEIISLDDNYIYRNRRVCRKHFPEKWHYSKNRLSCLAVPTLNLAGAALHVFPQPAKYPERFKTWAEIAGEKLGTLSENEVFKKLRICDVHFLPEHKTRNNRLCIIAEPLLCLPDSGRCILCGKSRKQLFNFPLEPEICRMWVKNVGIPGLARLSLQTLHQSFLCQEHFSALNEDGSLAGDAIPTEKLPHPPLSEDAMEDFPVQTEDIVSASSDDEPQSEDRPQEPAEVSGDEEIMFETEYLEDFEGGDEDIKEEVLTDDKLFTDDEMSPKVEVSPNVEVLSHKKLPTYDKVPTTDVVTSQQKTTDEIDSLFLSYAGTFRKIPAKLQTLLKLDLAKLFARYERKCMSLQDTSEVKIKEEKDDELEDESAEASASCVSRTLRSTAGVASEMRPANKRQVQPAVPVTSKKTSISSLKVFKLYKPKPIVRKVVDEPTDPLADGPVPKVRKVEPIQTSDTQTNPSTTQTGSDIPQIVPNKPQTGSFRPQLLPLKPLTLQAGALKPLTVAPGPQTGQFRPVMSTLRPQTKPIIPQTKPIIPQPRPPTSGPYISIVPLKIGKGKPDVPKKNVIEDDLVEKELFDNIAGEVTTVDADES